VPLFGTASGIIRGVTRLPPDDDTPTNRRAERLAPHRMPVMLPIRRRWRRSRASLSISWSGDPMRAEGFYWISYRGGLPEVARWLGNQWWATGEEIPLPGTDVAVLSTRLEPPSVPAW
jgi:hypothetical protein